jgi:hypothetical protein
LSLLLSADPRIEADLLTARVEDDLRELPVGSNTREASEKADRLQRHVRSALRLFGDDVSTIALVDWTSVFHVHKLFMREFRLIDPFVALADFTALVAAALFYDRVVVLDGDDLIESVRGFLGIGDALLSLPTRAEPTAEDAAATLMWTLEDCFQSAAAELSNLRPGSAFLEDLHAAWGAMLPGAGLPQEYDLNDVGWSLSPGRPALLRQLFEPTMELSWPLRFTRELVIDNDVRALTYENVAAVLTAAVSSAECAGPTVRYVGGVLRGPMQRAVRAKWRRAWDSRGGFTAESALNAWWQDHVANTSPSPAFPFWLSAILADTQSRDDVGKQIYRWRERAADLRKRRATLERRLLDRSNSETEPYRQALAGATSSLSEGALAGDLIATAALVAKSSVALTGIPPFFTDAATTVLDQEVKRLLKPTTSWLLRMTRPRLWFLARADQAAQRLREPQYRLNELFALPPGDKSAALAFLSRVNAVEWSV